MTDVPNLLDTLAGEHPGGCDDCDAYQDLRFDAGIGVWWCTVHHDDTCPWWRARRPADRGRRS